jgi:predicted O-methyltransferase YrrM
MTSPLAGPLTEHDAGAWQILSPLLVRGGYLPWTTGSMRPAGLVEVCNEIVHGDRTRILECGSGVSTVLLARLLRERERGVLTSLEHDPHWATLIHEHLQREQLSQIARVVHSPLQGNPPWYRLEEMPDEIDLLIVDGPPAFEPGHGAARAPALAHLDDKLVDEAAVILDDIGRPGEQQIIATWETSTSWRFQLNLSAGVAIGRRQTEPPRP